MAGKSTILCQEIVDYLKTQQIELPWLEIERRNFATVRGEEVLRPHVFVAPVAIQQTIETRKHWATFFRINICLCQMLNTLNITEQDLLIGVAEDLPLRLVDWRSSTGAYVVDIDDESTRVNFDEVQMETGTMFVASTIINFRGG